MPEAVNFPAVPHTQEWSHACEWLDEDSQPVPVGEGMIVLMSAAHPTSAPVYSAPGVCDAATCSFVIAASDLALLGAGSYRYKITVRRSSDGCPEMLHYGDFIIT